VRDNVTVAEVVRPLLERAGAPKTRWEFARQDASSLVPCIADARLQQVLLDLVEVADLGTRGDTFGEPARVAWKRVERHVDRLHRRVRAAARRFDELPLDAQHRVRKRLKRLRYLVEFVSERWPARPVRAYLAALEPAQDALGAHIGIATAHQRFMDDARHDPRSYFAAGFLKNELRRTARDAGAALRKLRRATRFWRR
jgi:CHAD domain-containing protein